MMQIIQRGTRGVMSGSTGQNSRPGNAGGAFSIVSRLSLWGALMAFAFFMLCVPQLRAQTTASMSGTVTDQTGAVIPGATVTLSNQATQAQRSTVTNGTGQFTLTAILPGTYTVRVSAKGFQGYAQSGISLTAGADVGLPTVKLAVGSAATTVTVHTTTQILPTINGEHAAVLSAQDIHKLALGARDITQLLKILPGVVTTPQGIGNTTAFSQVHTATSSTVGIGIVANGAPYRGGTTQLLDGVDITDPGCNCQAMSSANPDMTQEVTVETSNFGASSPFGPILISSISKSGGAQYHGEGYFVAENDALNAIDWQTKNAAASQGQKAKKGSAHYYYPGFNVGGPIPGTHKKLRFWFGYEKDIQNTGNANILSSFIPTSDMMNGQFGNTPANATFCTGTSIDYKVDNGCNDLTNTVLPNGVTLPGGGGAGSQIPAQFLDPGAKVLSSFWPKANITPVPSTGYVNYRQAIPGTVDGWTYRIRVDYSPTAKDQFFVSYQQGYTDELTQYNGAHIYWTPGNAIQYPGGGLYQKYYTKAIAANYVHTFGANLTNELIVAWGYLNAPVGPNNPNQATRSGLGYPYGTLFNTGSNILPAYSTAGSWTFPDFSEQDIFDNPSHQYLVKKELPSLADNLTWQYKNHTIKLGAFMEEVTNDQGEYEDPNGNFTNFNMYGGIPQNVITGQNIGSPNNPTANFLMGIATGYHENNVVKVTDMAYGDFAYYFDDTWKATSRLSIDYGVRIEHLGHWYDKNKDGEAVFIPTDVLPDYNSGRQNPGFRWHSVDSGIPSSGMPNRFAYLTPRFGMSYDVFGNGSLLVRGGWGIFRFADQYNNYTGPIQTSQEIAGYSLPGGTSIFFNQPQQAAATGGVPGQNGAPGIIVPTVGVGCSPSNPCIDPGQSGLDPTDDQIPDSSAWNLTIDKQLPLNFLLEAAYVGNHAENLPLGGEALAGSNFTDFDNVNKTPLGAYFKPDPVTGVMSPNYEDVTQTCVQGQGCHSTGNKTADYRPYGKIYGDNNVEVLDTAGYSNYDALQLALVRHGTNANVNVNWTYQNNLSTNMQEDAFHLRRNYGPATTTRRYVFNFSGSYTFQQPYKGQNLFLRGAANGWTISNITTWQSGGFLTSTNNPNFGMGLQYLPDYNGAPVSKTNPLPNGAQGTGISQATYYGTNATVLITPRVTCNPHSGDAANQLLKYSCFTPPPVGQYGPTSEPYTMVAYFDSDMSLYKDFHVWRDQHVEFRIQAFNWLNHPLRQFSGGNQLSLHYQVPYGTSNFQTFADGYPGNNPNNFGVLDQKNGAPNQRTLELSIHYLF
uniref:Carboxypeptidase regulatory-like domain-containing protein n=1 Tax=Acidobacterium capsulatum TaxID=33075 RepID=A0A7V4XSX6_9BACT